MSGKLTMNALIMYDRQTNSLWSHFLSEGIEGDFKGVRLTNVPLILTTWREWKQSFPETKALFKPGKGFDPYTSYYLRGDAGVIGESNRDERLYGKDLVLGVGFDDGPIAFPHTAHCKSEQVDQHRNQRPTRGNLLRRSKHDGNGLLSHGWRRYPRVFAVDRGRI